MATLPLHEQSILMTHGHAWPGLGTIRKVGTILDYARRLLLFGAQANHGLSR